MICQYDMCMSKIDMHGWLWITLAGVHSGARRLSMDQMNVSITDQLAGYVRKKVKSGRYNNASEVVREALRRMEEDDERALRLVVCPLYNFTKYPPAFSPWAG